MTFEEFHNIIVEQYKKRPDGNIEFWLGEKEVDIDEFSRFGFDGDVILKFTKFKKDKK